MPALAIAGRKPGRIPFSNTVDFIFSNPFRAESEVLRHAPSQQAKDHNVPQIPPTNPFLVDPALSINLSFERAHLDALRVAASLRTIIGEDFQNQKDGLCPVILIHLPNCVQFAPLLFGVFAAGFTATMANPALTPSELGWIIQSARPKAIVTTPAGLNQVEKAVSNLANQDLKDLLSNKDHLVVVDTSEKSYSGHSNIPNGARSWNDLLKSQPLERAVYLSEAECQKRTAVILWSSGTSGKSKGVRLSHSALVTSILAVWHVNQTYDAKERWLGMIPFFHVFGLINLLLLAPCCGATLYNLPKFDPRQMLDLIQKYRITFLHVAPPVALLLAKSPLLNGIDMSSIKGVVSGGAPLGTEAIEAIYKRLGILVFLGYGSSEACSVCNQFAQDWEELRVQLGSTGPPLYATEIKIVSTEEPRNTLAIGETGEIMVRSPSLMQGYLNNEAATQESFDEDGWLHTGDVGRLDDKGLLWVTDRLKDVIKVKGFQVAPADLEAVICSTDAVAEAGVTSIYDEESGSEFPRAYIVPADSRIHSQCTPDGRYEVSNDLRTLAEQVKSLVENNTANYKWLRGNIVFIQEVPKSPSGKILRRLLKDTKGVEVAIYAEKTKNRESKM